MFLSQDDDDDDDDDIDDDIDDDLFDDDFIDVEGGDDDEDDYDGDYDDDEDDEELEDDPYVGMVPSEFGEDPSSTAGESPSSGLATSRSQQLQLGTTGMDWGGALGALRTRVGDLESGKGGDPSQALFRLMSAPSPNQAIGQFVSNANPQVVQAMSGAVSSLLGGLSNPSMGVEIQVKASGEKIGNLCFQLQMTGYMFRNAEYVLALKQLIGNGSNKLSSNNNNMEDYKEAFDRLDTDNSGYIEISEIQELFREAYGGKEEDVPKFEITAFLEFFDTNEDGRISWEEFERGLTSSSSSANSARFKAAKKSKKDEFADKLMASMEEANEGALDDDDDDNDDGISESISGTIEIEMDDGKIVEVDAKEYMENLKEEAQKLKLALRMEKEGGAMPDDNSNSNNSQDPMAGLNIPNNNGGGEAMVDIASYVASRQGDVKSLTEGIKPEIVDTMKKLVDFVLEGGDSGRNGKSKSDDGAATKLSDQEKAEMEMEIPGSALQQLALWQLVLGYRLREEEAKGDYINLLK